MPDVRYEVHRSVDSQALASLFEASWVGVHSEYGGQLDHSLSWVCAYDSERLIGFVNVAWDGGAHAFILDTTVHPERQHLGIGTELVRLAAVAAREAGCEWLHVDYEADLATFYEACGFKPAAAGLSRL